MKTAEQIYKKYKNFLSAVTKEEVIRILEQIQKEAYNQAIEDAAEKAEVSLFDWIDSSFKEFKQNSNHYSINDGTYVKIDEQSILKLKI